MYCPLILVRLLLIGAIALVTTSCGLIALPLQIATLPLRIARDIIVGPPQPQTVYVDRRTVENAQDTEPPNDPRLNGAIAVKTVLRVQCSANGYVGTGFFHKSGHIITAAHVISECPLDNIELTLSDRRTTYATTRFYDASYDLAALFPADAASFNGWRVLNLSSTTTMDSGQQITTWGYPEGYDESKPLLTVGYISGYQSNPVYFENGKSRPFSTGLWMINAAINEGNSGSPVINISDGSVIGVVIRKQIAWTPEIERAINRGDHIQREALEALRQRSQYDIGYVVPSNAVADFLSNHGVNP